MDDALKRIQKLLDAAEADLHSARSLLRETISQGDQKPFDTTEKIKSLSVLEEGRVIEGIFNGQNMVGADGKEYPVPANYASKSKLVEGDSLKLTIGDDGSFMYKQIAPAERKKVIGSLALHDGNYIVNAEGKSYRVLQASITYYKGEAGDNITIIIPKEHDSNWAAVEGIIKQTEEGKTEGLKKMQLDKDIEESKPEKTPKDEEPKPISKAIKNDSGPNIEFPAEEVSEEIIEESPPSSTKEPENEEVKVEVKKDKQVKEEPAEDGDIDQGIKELEI